MRETILEKAGDRRVMRTDDAGTVLLDATDHVAAEHGTDMHDAMLEDLQGEGWAVTADGDRAPPGRPAKAPPQVAGDEGAPGIHATGNDAESG